VDTCNTEESQKCISRYADVHVRVRQGEEAGSGNVSTYSSWHPHERQDADQIRHAHPAHHGRRGRREIELTVKTNFQPTATPAEPSRTSCTPSPLASKSTSMAQQERSNTSDMEIQHRRAGTHLLEDLTCPRWQQHHPWVLAYRQDLEAKRRFYLFEGRGFCSQLGSSNTLPPSAGDGSATIKPN
jgi:hypothetical protein